MRIIAALVAPTPNFIRFNARIDVKNTSPLLDDGPRHIPNSPHWVCHINAGRRSPCG